MDFSKKLKELKILYNLPDVTSKYPEANDFELCILTLRNMS